MRWALLTGLATMLAAAMGWISFGHLLVFLGLEILTSQWFSRQRTLHATGPVTNPRVRPFDYVRRVDGVEERRTFAPVLGQPLSREDRGLLARQGSLVLSLGGLVGVGLGVFTDPSFFTPLALLSTLALTGSMALQEWRSHQAWEQAGHATRADPSVQMHDEFYRFYVLIFLGVSLMVLSDVPRLQTYTFAVVLLGCDLFLHGHKERWTGVTPRGSSGSTVGRGRTGGH